jgi:hypothetical protein
LSQQANIVQVGRSSTAAWVNGKAKRTRLVQRVATVPAGGHNGQVSVNQFVCEIVLLEYLRVAPTAGPVKFRNDGGVIFDADLVYTIFVTVQRKKSAIASILQVFQRSNDVLRLEIGVRE